VSGSQNRRLYILILDSTIQLTPVSITIIVIPQIKNVIVIPFFGKVNIIQRAILTYGEVLTETTLLINATL
jgi:hypothetical protein